MNLSAMVRGLMHLVRRAPADARGSVDAADLGTAFGLEASLLDSEQYEDDDPRWRSPVPSRHSR
jgi:hypothetical protein